MKVTLIKVLTISLFFSSCMNAAVDAKSKTEAQVQSKIEIMLKKVQKETKSEQIMVTIVNSTTGSLFFESSNASSYLFEPGSIMKPVTMALLLDKGVVHPSDLIKTENGRYIIGKQIIVDKHKFDSLSAEDVIVYSSNIGIVKLVQKLNGTEFYNGLRKFGFSKKTIPTPKKLDKKLYKATCSYGYGMRSNLIELVRAYSVFDNDGKMSADSKTATTEVIKKSTAIEMKNILIKTVQKNTDIDAQKLGLSIGGKTAIAHKIEKGRYAKKYNTLYVGFVDDVKHNKYTVGILVSHTKRTQPSTQNSVLVFKKLIEIMIESNYLIVKNR